MTDLWPEQRPTPTTVDVDSDDLSVIARAVWLAIDDGLPLRLHGNTARRRREVEWQANQEGHDTCWTWAATRIADATFTPRTGDATA